MGCDNLPKEFKIATKVATKGVKIVRDNAPAFIAGAGTLITSIATYFGVNYKEKRDTLEEYKGWDIWRQGKNVYAKKGKNKFKIESNNYKIVKNMIDAL